MFICKQYVRKRGDNGLPSVLKCVREAESIIIEQQLNHEYLGIIGDPEVSNNYPHRHLSDLSKINFTFRLSLTIFTFCFFALTI